MNYNSDYEYLEENAFESDIHLLKHESRVKQFLFPFWTNLKRNWIN